MKKSERVINGGLALTDRDVKRRKRVKIAVTALCIILILPLLGLGIVAAGFKIWSNGVELDASLLPTASAVPVFYDAYGNKLNYKADNYVSPDAIPENVKKAFVALEDKRFYSHKGYDPVRIAGAIVHNLKSGKVKEGASTITQQLVKNTHLTHERTVKRKLKEIAIASKLEKEYSKDEILAMYLSVIYFGGGAYGINQASKLYFSKAPDELSLAECATLAGIVKNPSKYSPKNSISNATERRNVVLDIMKKEGYITDDEHAEAKAEKMRDVRDGAKNNAEKFYLDRVVEELTAALNITTYQLNNSGYRIYTNLDSKLQKELAALSSDKSNFSSKGVDDSSVVIDNATGAVIAHYSSLPYEVRRQAGSTLKPLAVYAPAIDKGTITLATPVIDEKVDFNGFKPENFAGIYYGETTPREAVKRSMNSVAVKVMSYIGAECSADYLSRFGINVTDADKNYALALGATSKGVKPVQLAGAYSTLARGGKAIEPHYVKAVVDNGTKIYSSEFSGAKVVSEDAAYLMTSALLDTVRDGTARSLSVLPYEIAAKTGTVQRSGDSNTDAWNVSYTSAHTVAVWHGSSDMSETGGSYPTRQAAKIWKKIYGSDSPQPFSAPATVFEAEIDKYSSAKNSKLTLATKNTPDEYKFKELFSLSNLPDASNSRFEKIDAPEFCVELNQNRVKLSFDTEIIYDYQIIRRDVLGARRIFAFCGKDFENGFSAYDAPYSFGGAVEYELICSVSGLSDSPKASVKKQIFVNGGLR